MPITWKNITAPDFSASNRLAQAGQEQVQGAVDSLRGIIQDRGERQTDERENAALQRLSSLGTVEEVEDEFDSIAAGMGPSGDMSALLAAKTAHVSNIFERDKSMEFAAQKANRLRENELRMSGLEFEESTRAEDRSERRAGEDVERDINKLKAAGLAAELSPATKQANIAAAEQKHEDAMAIQRLKNVGNYGKGSGKASTLSTEYMDSVSNNRGEFTSTTKKKVFNLNAEFSDLKQKDKEAIFAKHTDPDYFGSKGVDLEAIRNELQTMQEKLDWQKEQATKKR